MTVPSAQPTEARTGRRYASGGQQKRVSIGVELLQEYVELAKEDVQSTDCQLLDKRRRNEKSKH